MGAVMKVSSRARQGVMVVSVFGRVLLPRTEVFSDWISSEVGDRWTEPVLLDCSGMTYINSAGLREILIFARRSAAHGGRFAVCGLSEPVRRTFEVVGFDQMLDIHESADEALDAILRAEPPGA